MNLRDILLGGSQNKGDWEGLYVLRARKRSSERMATALTSRIATERVQLAMRRVAKAENYCKIAFRDRRGACWLSEVRRIGRAKHAIGNCEVAL